jgi:hypothetical protein
MTKFNKWFTNRRSTHNFRHNEQIDMDKLNYVLNIFVTNMPSKQDAYPYQIHVIDWHNFELRQKIYETALPNPGIHEHINNQIFAPVLIGFTHSLIKDNNSYIAPVEIGMAAMALTYLLQGNNFLTSFCGCITDPNDLATFLTKKPNYTTRLFLCIGENTYVNYKEKIFNPFTNTFIRQKHNPTHCNNKPDIFYHTEIL